MSTTDDWSALGDEQRRYEAKRMAVYGAWLKRWIITWAVCLRLKSAGQYDNTLIIFTSDNGAEASGQPINCHLPHGRDQPHWDIRLTTNRWA